ncbi:transmembrane sensor protein [Bordetella ansorpii]|uniref:Transmembrane sensor protein n=1 Tax=Bordetella ansorpii TaxID=288768 RepID=A0A157NJA3_9BORD|nr:FecR family protein [Bordetella ansorpii]SAI21321.1 transmembrane sensor protein [Bordetella ansorpii]
MARRRQKEDPTEAAVNWMVLLRSGSATPADRDAFATWRDADDRHAEAWARLHTAIPGLVPGADGAAAASRRNARDVLMLPPRRVVLKSLVGAGVLLGLGGTAANRLVPIGQLTADLYTGTGERKRIELPDHSSLSLNARSAVDVDFSSSRRLVRLRAGSIVVRVASDPSRPFSVQTEDGLVTALGTQFMVRQDARSTRVAVLEHQVEIATARGAHRLLKEGEGADFDAAQVRSADVSQATGAEWLNGHLLVNRQPLSYVIGELQRYRRGVLRVSPDAADIPVQGGFPLDDVDASLAGLADTLPITLHDYGGWLTLIDRR